MTRSDGLGYRRWTAVVVGLLVGLCAVAALGGVGAASAQPDFEIVNVRIDGPISTGDSLSVGAVVTNTGNEGTQTVTLDVAGSQRDSETVSIRPGVTDFVTLDWTPGSGDAGQYTATVASDNDTATQSVTILNGNVSFSVDITGTTAPIIENQTLSVDYNVTNIGSLSGSQTVSLEVAGAQRDTTNLTLDAGKSAQGALSWATQSGDAGEYTATVSSDNTSESVPVTVESGDSGDSSGSNGASNMSTVDNLTDGNLVEVIAATYGSAMPLVFFVGIVCSLIILTIYINSRSLTLTAIVTMLSGGVVVEYLPPPVRVAGYALIVVGVAAVGASIYLGRERPIR
jgi:hypothetical protein